MLRLKGCDTWGPRELGVPGGLAWREPAGPSSPAGSQRRSWAPALQGEWDRPGGWFLSADGPCLGHQQNRTPSKGSVRVHIVLGMGVSGVH